MDIAVEVRKAVSGAFPGVPIYTETVRQGASEPCFYVRLSSEDRRKELGRRYRHTYVFEIRYCPSPEDADETGRVGGELLSCLELLPESGARGRKLDMKTKGKELFATVMYRFCAQEEEPDGGAVMQSVSQTVALGG